MMFSFESRDERRDMDDVIKSIYSLDRGIIPESEENKPKKWNVKCGVLLRGKLNNSSGLLKGTDNVAKRIFRIEDPVNYEHELVFIIPQKQQPAPPVHNRQNNSNINQTNSSSSSNNSGGNVNSNASHHTVVQTSKNFSNLPFFASYQLRKEFSIEGNVYIVGDFVISAGVLRLPPKVQIIIQIRHIPCEITPTASCYKEITQAIGLGTRFPNYQQIQSTLHRYGGTFGDIHGPKHQSIEIADLLSALVPSLFK